MQLARRRDGVRRSGQVETHDRARAEVGQRDGREPRRPLVRDVPRTVERRAGRSGDGRLHGFVKGRARRPARDRRPGHDPVRECRATGRRQERQPGAERVGDAHIGLRRRREIARIDRVRDDLALLRDDAIGVEIEQQVERDARGGGQVVTPGVVLAAGSDRASAGVAAEHFGAVGVLHQAGIDRRREHAQRYLGKVLVAGHEFSDRITHRIGRARQRVNRREVDSETRRHADAQRLRHGRARGGRRAADAGLRARRSNALPGSLRTRGLHEVARSLSRLRMDKRSAVLRRQIHIHMECCPSRTY